MVCDIQCVLGEVVVWSPWPSVTFGLGRAGIPVLSTFVGVVPATVFMYVVCNFRGQRGCICSCVGGDILNGGVVFIVLCH